MKEKWKRLLILIVITLPSVFLQVVLINLFPYTGLERIITIPLTVVVNLMITIICILLIKRKKSGKCLTITFALSLTIVVTVGLYSQEFNPPILVQSINAVGAIQDYNQIHRSDLESNGHLNDPRYVVALYKYKDDLLDEGIYQLYQRENVYFYSYSINELDEIPSKLIGYHKVMWWYLNLLNY